MPYADEDFIMISALQHYCFCPRQFALIYMEQYWRENYWTSEGKHLHERVDLPGKHRSAGRRVEYALPLVNRELGITGVADAVEFITCDGVCRAAPVEYKRGKEKEGDCDRIQLCAQVLCLEEMTRETIREGWLFYLETRSRVAVPIDEELRRRCRMVIEECRTILDFGKIPEAVYVCRRCRACSLAEYCMPLKQLRSFRGDFEESLR